jgi:hypothetical protein
MMKIFGNLFKLTFLFLLFPQISISNTLPYGDDEKKEGNFISLTHVTQNLIVTIPSLDLAARLALNLYPELKDSEIEIIEGNITTSMLAQPKFLSLMLNSKENRKYKVVVNSNKESAKSNLIYELDLEGQVALLAHEFAHLLDYSTQSKYELMGTGIAYSLIPSYKTDTEHQADHEVINRGLGKGLLQFTSHVFSHERLTKKYKKYKKRYYLSPEEIASAVNP